MTLAPHCIVRLQDHRLDNVSLLVTIDLDNEWTVEPQVPQVLVFVRRRERVKVFDVIGPIVHRRVHCQISRVEHGQVLEEV